jgi:formate dehydrogenase subunit delta
VSVERLVAMANDIAGYFESEPDREGAVTGVATHIRRYWTPRMREQINAHCAAGGSGLTELARAGIEQLNAGSQRQPAPG